MSEKELSKNYLNLKNYRFARSCEFGFPTIQIVLEAPPSKIYPVKRYILTSENPKLRRVQPRGKPTYAPQPLDYTGAEILSDTILIYNKGGKVPFEKFKLEVELTNGARASFPDIHVPPELRFFVDIALDPNVEASLNSDIIRENIWATTSLILPGEELVAAYNEPDFTRALEKMFSISPVCGWPDVDGKVFIRKVPESIYTFYSIGFDACKEIIGFAAVSSTEEQGGTSVVLRSRVGKIGYNIETGVPEIKDVDKPEKYAEALKMMRLAFTTAAYDLFVKHL